MRILLENLNPEVFQCQAKAVTCSAHSWERDKVSELLALAQINRDKTVFIEASSLELASIVLEAGLSNVKFNYHTSSPSIEDVKYFLQYSNVLIDDGVQKLNPCDHLNKYFPDIAEQTLRRDSEFLLKYPEVLYICLLQAIAEDKVSRQDVVTFLLGHEFPENPLACEWQAFLCEALMSMNSFDDPMDYIYGSDHIGNWICKIEGGELPWNMNILIRRPSRKEILEFLKLMEKLRLYQDSPEFNFKHGVLRQGLQDSFRRLRIIGVPGPAFVINALKIKPDDQCEFAQARLDMLALLEERLNAAFRGPKQSYQLTLDQHVDMPFGSLDQNLLFLSDKKPGVIYMKTSARGGTSIANQMFCPFIPTEPIHTLILADQQKLEE